MTDRVLLVSPSHGRGGGIERYVETLESAFVMQDVDYCRVDLRGGGLTAHSRLLAQCRRQMRVSKAPTRLVIAHRSLLPVASLLAREHPGCGISLVCHGIDVWASQRHVRPLLERSLMHMPRVRLIAVSSFTAGMLFNGCRATVLPPGLSRGWFDMLIEASNAAQSRSEHIQLVTAFRLADWRNKGLPQLLDAVSKLDRLDVQVIVCGSGEPEPELLRLISKYPYCRLRAGLADHELARQLAEADLFVLATRMRRGSHPSGEGFGMVLLEAQVAGTPVVGPAFGGSHDAFIERVTGLAPVDETSASLARVLDELLSDPKLLSQMSDHAAEWSRKCFDPDVYSARAVARLL
jgi:phosphatidylinositol alpha-1,6-mannosyltransferase